MYRAISKLPTPPRANPRAFDFFEKFWSNSPLCFQFRRLNAPPVGASKRVKSPTLQACEANCGNKLCKILSHYEFLVQLVFAPKFKQRHIPRQNYIERQHQKTHVESTRGMTRERGSPTESKNCEILFASDRWQTFWHGSHFGSNSPLYGAWRESNARGLPGGGDGRFWNWLVH